MVIKYNSCEKDHIYLQTLKKRERFIFLYYFVARNTKYGGKILIKTVNLHYLEICIITNNIWCGYNIRMICP